MARLIQTENIRKIPIMIFRRILAALFVLCAFHAWPAHAQSTKAQLNAQIGVQFPDNTTFEIMPLNLRTVTESIVNSIMPNAPVTNGNLVCFNGTTGALEDCALSPSAIPIGNISGLGSGVATALGVNVGTAGAVVINGGALGTPSSATLSTGVSINASNITWSGVVPTANLPAATASTLGTVQPDDSTITISAGVITSVTRHQIGFNSVSALVQASTLFVGAAGNNANSANTQYVAVLPGAFLNLQVISAAPATGQTITVAMFVNGSASAVTCTITGPATTCSDTTHTASITAGQTYTLRAITSATTGSIGNFSAGVELEN